MKIGQSVIYTDPAGKDLTAAVVRIDSEPNDAPGPKVLDLTVGTATATSVRHKSAVEKGKACWRLAAE